MDLEKYKEYCEETLKAYPKEERVMGYKEWLEKEERKRGIESYGEQKLDK